MERSCFWVCIVGSCRAIYTMRSFVLGWQKLGFGSEARDEFLKKRAVARSRKYCVFSFWPHIWPTIALLKEVSNFPSNLWVKFIMWPLSTVAQRSKIILFVFKFFLGELGSSSNLSVTHARHAASTCHRLRHSRVSSNFHVVAILQIFTIFKLFASSATFLIFDYFVISFIWCIWIRMTARDPGCHHPRIHQMECIDLE